MTVVHDWLETLEDPTILYRTTPCPDNRKYTMHYPDSHKCRATPCPNNRIYIRHDPDSSNVGTRLITFLATSEANEGIWKLGGTLSRLQKIF